MPQGTIFKRTSGFAEDHRQSVFVTIFTEHGDVCASIDRALFVAHGGISKAEHVESGNVPDILVQATEILEELRPFGFDGVYVRLGVDTRWDPAWGTLLQE